MTPHRQARLDAATALLELGWQPERVALALTISRATVERLMPKRTPATPLLAATMPPTWGVCCHREAGRYCNAPTMLGTVYCAGHTSDGLRL